VSGRLIVLYLQSRRAGAALAVLAAVAAIAWWGLDRSHTDGLEHVLLTVMPLGAAAVIGAGAGSPFGETERTASRSVPALRLGHLGGLLLIAALTLAMANRAEPAADTAWTLVRNGAGYAGLALLGARLLGARLAWVVPIAYGLAVLVTEASGVPPERWWMWPVEDAPDGSARASALLLLAVGLLAIVPTGARETPGEAE
jgi:hypothetical protein